LFKNTEAVVARAGANGFYVKSKWSHVKCLT